MNDQPEQRRSRPPVRLPGPATGQRQTSGGGVSTLQPEGRVRDPHAILCQIPRCNDLRSQTGPVGQAKDVLLVARRPEEQEDAPSRTKALIYASEEPPDACVALISSRRLGDVAGANQRNGGSMIIRSNVPSTAE